MNQYIREEKTGDIEGAPSNPPTGTSQRRSFESTNSEVESVDGSHKKKRLFWNEELHGKFVKAVEKLGIGTTPKKILEFMADPRVKIRQVASHLQTYRKQIGYTNASQSLDDQQQNAPPINPDELSQFFDDEE